MSRPEFRSDHKLTETARWLRCAGEQAVLSAAPEPDADAALHDDDGDKGEYKPSYQFEFKIKLK